MYSTKCTVESATAHILHMIRWVDYTRHKEYICTLVLKGVQSPQYQHTCWLISACSRAAALTSGLYSLQPGSAGNESYEKRRWSFNLSPAGPGETYRAVQDWVPARWSDRRLELTRSSVGWGTGWRGGRVEEVGGRSTGKQCEPLFSTYHPLPGVTEEKTC